MKNTYHLTDVLVHCNELFAIYGQQAVTYVLKNLTNLRCNHCGHIVLREPSGAAYPYQCLHCDENMFGIEVTPCEEIPDAEMDELVRLTQEQKLYEEE